VADWLEHLRAVRGRAPATLARYRRLLAQLAEDVGGDLGAVTRDDLERFMRNLFIAGASASTRAGLVSAARGFYDYLAARGAIEESPAARLRGPSGRYEQEAPHLTIPEVRRLVFGGRPGTIPGEAMAARDRVMVAVSYVCGLRVSEPGRLRVDDLAWDEKERIYSVLVRRAKWADRDHRIPVVQPVVSRMLGAYLGLRARRWPGCEWLFPTAAGGSMGAGTAQKVFGREIQRAGIERRGRRVTFHILRHSIATHLHQRGMREEEIGLWLRHRDGRSTRRYVHVSDERLVRAWRKRDPLSSRGEDPPDVHAVGRALAGDLAAVLGFAGAGGARSSSEI
jgi:site-specific recombinase XerD